ncbi:hypothetical protein T492DRAFT_849875 [Pavlovales sp. CCMP2436]|nr:hypothetical protein T492DRAFT_849875 [Pavlovales sp. CCMP2436]
MSGAQDGTLGSKSPVVEMLIVREDGVRVHLIGTCHLSDDAAQYTAARVRELRPSTVVVELCEERRSMLNRGQQLQWRTQPGSQVTSSSTDPRALLASLTPPTSIHPPNHANTDPTSPPRLFISPPPRLNIPPHTHTHTTPFPPHTPTHTHHHNHHPPHAPPHTTSSVLTNWTEIIGLMYSSFETLMDRQAGAEFAAAATAARGVIFCV